MHARLADGSVVFADETGAGPPVLLLHGVPDTSAVWRHVTPALAARRRCVALDLPGFGGSSAPDTFDASLDGMARWVEDALNVVGIEAPVDLVVHDFGGVFGLAWAVRHPARVRRLVILNTVFFPDYRWHFWARVWRTPLLGELSFACNSRWGLSFEMRRGSRRLPRAHAFEAFARLTPAATRMILRLYRATDPADFAPWQHGLRALMATVPALVLWGDRDPYIDASFAERFGAREVRHLPDAGHWLQVEEPGAVGEHLVRFLA